MGLPIGAAPAAAPPPPVVTALTNIQVTDTATGIMVLGPTAAGANLGGASILHANGVLRVIVQVTPANIHNGGPIIGNQYDITSTQGVFNNLQFLNNTPFLYRFG